MTSPDARPVFFLLSLSLHALFLGGLALFWGLPEEVRTWSARFSFETFAPAGPPLENVEPPKEEVKEPEPLPVEVVEPEPEPEPLPEESVSLDAPLAEPEPAQIVVPEEPADIPEVTEPSEATPMSMAAFTPPPSIPTGPTPEERARYRALVRERIRKSTFYPPLAVRRGIEGTALVSFVIRRDGGIHELDLLESSGSKILDKAARKIIEKGTPFPFPPWEDGEAFVLRSVPITFELVDEF